MEKEHIVIVGAGQAGASVALRLRSGGFEGDITMIGEESALPYQRPPLSKKYLSGEWDRERLLLRPAAFWEGAGIVIRTDLAAMDLNLAGRTLRVGSQRLSWSKLVLATGTLPRPMPGRLAELGGVHELRTLRDVERLRPAFVTGRRMLVIGGGFIGLETAAVAATAGLVVTVVERAPRILERAVCAQTSDYIRAVHAANGVRIIENAAIAEVLGDVAITGVELETGEVIEADLALVGIGVLPRVSLAEEAGIVCDNGAVVDAFGRTSAENVWAAGDCANFPFEGGRLRLESVQNAVDQAEIVADDILGRSRPYAPVPWFWSDQYEEKLQIAGLNRGYDAVVSRHSERGLANWYLRDGRAIAVDAVNDARTYMAARKLFEGGIRLDASEVLKPDFDPVAILRR